MTLMSIFLDHYGKNKEYYIIILIELVILLTSFLFIFLKKKEETEKILMEKGDNNAETNFILINNQENITNNVSPLPVKNGVNSIEQLAEKEHRLKVNYLIVYSLARSVMWLKTPFVVLNFINLKYSMDEILLLYFLDLFSALLFGPYLGNNADIYGRKNLSSFYFAFTCIDLLLKIWGNSIGIIISCIVNGLTTVLIHNSFESWINSESRIITNEFNRMVFLKSIYKDSNIYDSICSLVCSLFTLILYTNFGSLSPLWASAILSVIGLVVLEKLWDESVKRV